MAEQSVEEQLVGLRALRSKQSRILRLVRSEIVAFYRELIELGIVDPSRDPNRAIRKSYLPRIQDEIESDGDDSHISEWARLWREVEEAEVLYYQAQVDIKHLESRLQSAIGSREAIGAELSASRSLNHEYIVTLIEWASTGIVGNFAYNLLQKLRSSSAEWLAEDEIERFASTFVDMAVPAESDIDLLLLSADSTEHAERIGWRRWRRYRAWSLRAIDSRWIYEIRLREYVDMPIPVPQNISRRSTTSAYYKMLLDNGDYRKRWQQEPIDRSE